MIHISDFDYLMIITVIHMYFWVLLFRALSRKQKDWVSIFLIAFAGAIASSLQNGLIKSMSLPWVLKIAFFSIYVAITWRIYYEYKQPRYEPTACR